MSSVLFRTRADQQMLEEAVSRSDIKMLIFMSKRNTIISDGETLLLKAVARMDADVINHICFTLCITPSMHVVQEALKTVQNIVLTFARGDVVLCNPRSVLLGLNTLLSFHSPETDSQWWPLVDRLRELAVKHGW